MNKFLSWDFAFLLILMLILMIIHELGHYLAYRLLGYKAVVRRSALIPGIDPANTIEVKRSEGLIIALGGFIFSTILIVLTSAALHYRHTIVLLIGSVAGSIIDFIWAMTMLFKKTVTIYSK